jgi:hypothetical protein
MMRATPTGTERNHSRAEALRLYRDHITEKIRSGEVDLEVLRGKTLGCWCKPEPCHGDVLVELLARARPNGEDPTAVTR